MKVCNACGREKPLASFNTNGWYEGKNARTRKYKPACKACENTSNRGALRDFIKDFYGEYACSDCGFTGHPCQFDCHHLVEDTKDFKINQSRSMVKGSPDRLRKELEKCVLLCANCHRLRHLKYG